jgi:CubicO group peptidase (beta-lactamase class C family)
VAGLRKAFKQIDHFTEQFARQVNIPGVAIGITDREALLWVSTYGCADLATQKPVTVDTMFEIGSLGKPFTSLALLQMHDEGILDLNAPARQYLPWFHVQSEYPPITVHNLLNHTAGIVRGTDLAPYGLYEAWALRHTKVAAPPGEFFWYSNIGYKTVGFLLEQVSGQPLQDVLQSRVLNPLGMSHTRPVVTFETRKLTASGYTPFYDDRPEHPSHGLIPAVPVEYATADGCQASTPGDMAIYLRLLLNRGQGPQGRLISAESFDRMTLHGVDTGGDYYGYGIAWSQADGPNYLHHGGGNAAYMGAIALDTNAGFGVVVLGNKTGDTGLAEVAARYTLTVLRAASCGEQIPLLPPASYTTSIPDAADYAGTYRQGSRVLELIADNGTLLLNYAGQCVALERRNHHNFYVGLPGFELFLLEFQRDNGKVVEAFHGSDWYIGEGYSGPQQFDFPPAWESYLGHYRARNPEVSNFRVVKRKGALVVVYPWGAVEPLTPLQADLFRIGEDPRSPELLRFSAVVEGRALRADYSGCPYYRTFTP